MSSMLHVTTRLTADRPRGHSTSSADDGWAGGADPGLCWGGVVSPWGLCLCFCFSASRCRRMPWMVIGCWDEAEAGPALPVAVRFFRSSLATRSTWAACSTYLHQQRSARAQLS